MFLRYLSSAPLGIAVTASLLLLMNLLIDSGPQAAIATPPRMPLTLGIIRPPETLNIDEEKPQPIPDPAIPPSLPPTGQLTTDHGPVIGIPVQHAPTGLTGPVDFGNASTGLINIIKVRPVYPVKAERLGLEGYVIVGFDVTGAGTVVNVSVLESSNDVFNRAAINAAERFRFKARAVDGQPVATYGLMNKFVFRMEE